MRIDDLEALLEDMAEAQPDPADRRAAVVAGARRHRAMVSAAMVGALVLIAGSLAVAWSASGGSTTEVDTADEVTEGAEMLGVGSAPDGVAVQPPVVAVGDWLLALADEAAEPTSPQLGLLRSGAPGTAWEMVELPDQSMATGDLYWSLAVQDGVAVVTANEFGTGDVPLYVWTSVDGEQWTGGLVGRFEATTTLDAVHVHDGVLVSLVVEEDRLLSVSSADGGDSWQATPVSDLSVGEHAFFPGSLWSGPEGELLATIRFVDDSDPGADAVMVRSPSSAGPWEVVEGIDCSEGTEPRGPCYPVVEAGELLARGLEVSHDGGATWSVADFTTSLVDDRARLAHMILGFTSLVELPSGDWIGRVSGHILAGGGRVDWVVRSADGGTWDTVLGPGLDGCTDTPADTELFGAAGPLVVGEDVLVAFACPGRDPSLYRISQDHQRPVTVERLPPGRFFGAPMESNGEVVVPIVDAIGEAIHGFLVLDDS